MPLRADDVAKYSGRQSLAPTRRGLSVVERADQVPLSEIFEELGFYIPTGIVNSWKTRCPFGHEHKDGGVEPDCRVYPSNSGYCWAMHGMLTPTTVISYHRKISRKRAAVSILEARNLLRGRSYTERWQDLERDRKESKPEAGGPEEIIAALQRDMAAVPGYEDAEFAPQTLETWRVVLARLDEILPSGSLPALRAWFDQAKTDLTHSALTAVKQVE